MCFCQSERRLLPTSFGKCRAVNLRFYWNWAIRHIEHTSSSNTSSLANYLEVVTFDNKRMLSEIGDTTNRLTNWSNHSYMVLDFDGTIIRLGSSYHTNMIFFFKYKSKRPWCRPAATDWTTARPPPNTLLFGFHPEKGRRGTVNPVNESEKLVGLIGEA